jgi:hypothetical protein
MIAAASGRQKFKTGSHPSGFRFFDLFQAYQPDLRLDLQP